MSSNAKHNKETGYDQYNEEQKVSLGWEPKLRGKEIPIQNKATMVEQGLMVAEGLQSFKGANKRDTPPIRRPMSGGISLSTI